MLFGHYMAHPCPEGLRTLYNTSNLCICSTQIVELLFIQRVSPHTVNVNINKGNSVCISPPPPI